MIIDTGAKRDSSSKKAEYEPDGDYQVQAELLA